MAAIQMQVMPLPNGPRTIAVNGRSYVGTVGTYQTVPFTDGQMLIANNWLTNCARGCGVTADRPALGSIDVQASLQGTTFFDTTLNALIVWDGVNWRNNATGAIA